MTWDVTGASLGLHAIVPWAAPLTYLSLIVFCTSKNMVAKIAHSSSEMVLRTTKQTMIYPGSGPALEIIALRPAV
jgi:hypothetical protein